jgi:hypothetical protein
MKRRISYPTDYDNYDDLLDATYGDFDKTELIIPSLDNPAILKRFYTLFPTIASREIQKILISEEDILISKLSKSFSEIILPFVLHKELYNFNTIEEVRNITNRIKRALDKGEWDKDPNPPPEDYSEDFKKGYKKVLLPFTHTPLPDSLIVDVKNELHELESFFSKNTFSGYKTHPADIFVLKVQQIGKDFFTYSLETILLEYPHFPEGKGADSSEWSSIKSIKWWQKIQNYIHSVSEINYTIEPFLLKTLSQKAITIEEFLNLDLGIALGLQNQAEEAYKIDSQEEPKLTQKDITTTKLIPWRRERDSLKSLWEVLTTHGYIGSEVTYPLLSSHFTSIGNESKTQKGYSVNKIVWKTLLTNLLLLIRDLNKYGIINANPFKGKENSTTDAAIYNLIEEHFCRPNLEGFSIEAIRKSSQRITGNTQIDPKFLVDVHKHVQLIK